MISKLFLHIYTLTIPGLMSICIFCLICFLLLAHYCRAQWWWKPALGSLLLLWVGIVSYVTILSRTSTLESSLALIPFHSYLDVLAGGNPELIRSNLMNAALFYPAGLLCAGLSQGHFRVGMCCTVALLALFSLSIELSQDLWQLGNAEIDDVIHDTLGAVAGFAAFHLKWIDRPPKKNECAKKEYQP